MLNPQTITWSHPCYYCQRPITRGRPTLLFSINKHEDPALIGVSHSTCCFAKLKYAHFQMCPPNYLSNEQISFLVHFFPSLYKLPGGFDPNKALRYCLVGMHYDMPDSLDNPMKYLRNYQRQNRNKQDIEAYKGDLESDFLKFLGQVQRLVKEKPVDVEADFGKPQQSKQLK